jgi:DNA polymerase-3 subunit delta
MPCHLVHGTDEFRIAKRVDELLASGDLASELNLHRFDLNLNPSAFAESVECAFTPPFIGGQRVVLVEGIGCLEKKVRASLGDEREEEPDLPATEIAVKLKKLPESALVILFDRIRKLDGRGKLFKTLSSFCKVDEIKSHFFDPLSGYNRDLEHWIGESAEAQGIRLTPAGVAELLLRLGNDLRAVETEMEKFRLAYGKGAVIDVDEVAVLTPAVTAHSIFNLCDALGQGKLQPALGFLHGMLAAKSPPPYILTMLARHVRNMAIARRLYDTGKSKEVIQEALGMKSGWVFSRFQPQAQRFRGTYHKAHAILSECDEQLKTSGLDSEIALELCVIRLSTLMGAA